MLAHKRTAHIIGAGVSGLVTGWKLLERGWNVEIIEREPFYGGMSRIWRRFTPRRGLYRLPFQQSGRGSPARGQLPVDWERAIESFKVLDRCGVEALVVGAEREVKL